MTTGQAKIALHLILGLACAKNNRQHFDRLGGVRIGQQCRRPTSGA